MSQSDEEKSLKVTHMNGPMMEAQEYYRDLKEY